MYKQSGTKAAENLETEPPDLRKNRGTICDENGDVVYLPGNRTAETEMTQQSVVTKLQPCPNIRPVVPVESQLIQEQAIGKQHEQTKWNKSENVS